MEIYAKFKKFLLSTRRTGSANDETHSGRSRIYVKYKHVSGDNEDTDLRANLSETRSIDEILDDIGLRLFHFKAFLILGLLTMTVSFEISMVSIILPSVKVKWNISSVLAGVLACSLSIGYTVGCWFWGWIFDKYGRKRGFIGGAISIMIFGFANAFSPNYYWLWITLFLVGFALASSVEVYVMTMELFPPKFRTMFSVLTQVFFTLGFLFSAVTSIQLSEIGQHWALALVCFPTVIFLIGIIFLPDTPYFYLAAGDEQKALNILQDFGPEMNLNDTRLKHEPESKRADITQLFRSGYWKITICTCIMAFSVVMVFYVLIFTASDVGSRHNQTSTIEILENSKFKKATEDTMYSIMAWMNLPELAILITASIACYVFAVKNVAQTLLVLPITLQIVTLLVLKQRAALLAVTILCRSLLLASLSVVVVYVSMLYPTANRSLGVGFCLSTGHVGMVLGPFIFEALFTSTYLYGIVFNIGILMSGLLATVLLPSRSSATLG